MAGPKFSRTTWWFLSFQIILAFLLVVQGSEEADESFRNNGNFISEFFLPINFPLAVEMAGREKREVEGSGEEEPIVSDINEKPLEIEIDNSTQKVVESEKFISNLTNIEGSGEIDASESLTEDANSSPIIVETEDSVEVFTTTEVQRPKESEEVTRVITEDVPISTEMFFDKSEDFKHDIPAETTTDSVKETTTERIPEKATTEIEPAATTFVMETTTITPANETKAEEVTKELIEVTETPMIDISTEVLETTTEIPTEATTVIPAVIPLVNLPENKTEAVIPKGETTTQMIEETTIQSIETLPPPVETTKIPIDIPQHFAETTIGLMDIIQSFNITTIKPIDIIPVRETTPDASESHPIQETTLAEEIKPTEIPQIPSESPKITFETHPTSEVLPQETNIPTTLKPIVEEMFKAVKTAQETLEAMPGNILRKENLTMGADPLLIVTNTRTMDSEENVQLSSTEPKRLGAYIVIGLILLSFFSLVGYITFRKRMNRKRQEFESNHESNDTEKALLSLSDYKDSTELEENHLKNNEITPIVVKSNTQLNRFEKNTNFSSPKNLNTIANEKNIEKDNVLKSTAENLTQVIIEDSPKDPDEEKNAPSMEKLIVKTRIDQDSIPKKPIIVNRSSSGYMPIPQDNV